MENLMDFEVAFYNGVKIYFSNESSKLIQPDGSSLMLESSEGIKDLAPNMWEYCMECLEHCHRLEELYKKVESSGFNIFPVTVGRRPDIDSPNSSPLQPLQPVGSSIPTDSYIQPMSDVSNTQTKSQEQEDMNTEVTNGCLNLPPKFPAVQAEQTSTLNKSVSSNSSKSSSSRKSGPFSL